MNVDFSPKAQFQENEEAARDLARVVDSDHFRLAATHALADFSLRCNPTQEEMIGARRFLTILFTLAFKDTPPPEYPVRRIDHTAYDQPRPK